MLKKVRSYIEEQHMIQKGDRIVLGVSGGADSVALLIVMNQLKTVYDLTLYVVHIDHGIREEALQDAAYVRQLCKTYELPFYLFSADIPALAKQEKRTEEEMGRLFRYRQFYQVMRQEQANRLAVAHHMGDQAETVLFHLVRGSDLSGMAGIRPVSEVTEKMAYEDGVVPCRDRKTVCRPLLSCTKEEITGWLTEQHVQWREDSTNQDNTYTRNQIRNVVLPMLAQMNGRAQQHIAEFAIQAAEYEKFFQKAVRAYMEQQVHFGTQVCETDRFLLEQQDRILSHAVIYEMITFVCGSRKDITREHVQAVHALLERQSGRRIALPYQAEAEIAQSLLRIHRGGENGTDHSWRCAVSLTELSACGVPGQVIDLPWGGRLVAQVWSMEERSVTQRKKLVSEAGNLKNVYTKFFDCATIKDTLYVRTPEKEDYFILNARGEHKRLARHFMDQKLPVWERGRQIVVAQGHEVLWVVGGRRCEAYRIDDNTKNVLVLMYEGEKNELSY
ncbi:MAG: tRNA lysidine(34) synthetase TilS [Lachnospiraceae bacterium]|nr:tRNA lysidine(34) synthetase TilS [Lachnospiraceae bacterium]